jgi:SAM-dependent methyltransferase
MSAEPGVTRAGDYASRGEYHRHLDASWDYLPTYLAKIAVVREYLESLPAGTRVLDAGCGEGLLVEEFAERLRIEGVDLHYGSARVHRGSLTALPFKKEAFNRVLCLDALEHLPFDAQAAAIDELFRVLAKDGEALVSVPNLAHLQSRVHFLVGGRLIRTSSISRHPGDRPVGEYLDLFREAGFVVVRRRGIFPTVPVLTTAIRRRPVALAWLHRALTSALPIPGWCFLNLVWLDKLVQLP